MRTENACFYTETDPTVYQEHIKLIREISQVLRKNIVQAVKKQDPQHEGQDIWSA